MQNVTFCFRGPGFAFSLVRTFSANFRRLRHRRTLRWAVGLVFLISCNPQPAPLAIALWYGEVQHFGTPGTAQRWINVLGTTQSESGVAQLSYQLNQGPTHPLSTGPDGRRLAQEGNFNVEIHRDSLRVGENKVVITAVDSAGITTATTVRVHYDPPRSWPLPYAVVWDEVDTLQRAVQIVDGHWQRVPGGIRTVMPYYDRVIAVGDTSWTNYEVSTSVIFHGFTPPRAGPPTFGVSHAAIATRWPGHDHDKEQPHVKWFPLGATAEFRLTDQLDSCRWRVFDGESLYVEDTAKIRKIVLETRYRMKHRVQQIDSLSTRYQVKFWQDNEEEPTAWDLEAVEESTNNINSGSALLLAHNTDVTFGDIRVVAVE